MEFAALSNGGGFFYSSSSLPMRSLNMIAPSRGMATTIARPAPFSTPPLSPGAAFSVLPRLLPGKRPIGLQGALACIYEDCNGQIKQDMTG